jgi:hypothetical protein
MIPPAKSVSLNLKGKGGGDVAQIRNVSEGAAIIEKGGQSRPLLIQLRWIGQASLP